MATNDPSSSVGRFAAPDGFRTNARIHVSETVMDLLMDVATEPHVAVLVDVDALERSKLARVDRVMVLAMDGLCHVNVQLVLLARHERERAARLHGELPRSYCIEHTESQQTLAQIRARLPGSPLIGISDDPDLLAALSEHDRGIALGANYIRTRTNLAATSDLNVRAALWWIVDVRWKAGMVRWI